MPNERNKINFYNKIFPRIKPVSRPPSNAVPAAKIATDKGRVLIGTAAACAARTSINSANFSRNDLENSVTAVMSLRNWSSEGIWR